MTYKRERPSMTGTAGFWDLDDQVLLPARPNYVHPEPQKECCALQRLERGT